MRARLHNTARGLLSAHLFRRMAALLIWPAAALVIWGELSPSVHLPFSISKAGHLTGHFTLGLLAVLAGGPERRGLGTLAALVGLGALLEFLQRFTGRDPAIRDAFINASGALIGWAMGHVVWQRYAQHKEAEWFLLPAPGDGDGAACLVHRSQFAFSLRHDVNQQLKSATRRDEMDA